jgi:hypothetical protein
MSAGNDHCDSNIPDIDCKEDFDEYCDKIVKVKNTDPTNPEEDWQFPDEFLEFEASTNDNIGKKKVESEATIPNGIVFNKEREKSLSGSISCLNAGSFVSDNIIFVLQIRMQANYYNS